MSRTMRFRPLVLSLVLSALVLSGCGLISRPTSTALGAAPSMEQAAQSNSFELTSAAFDPGQPIPTEYTCDGEDSSPPLEWRNPPENVKSYALLVDDPDAPAGTWVHWVLYNLPAESVKLAEAVPPDPTTDDGAQQGKNSWKRLGYDGPCPPGGTHRYFFKLYALDTVLEIGDEPDKAELMQAMEGHILAQTDLMGTYARE